jgi:hypothetical protein
MRITRRQMLLGVVIAFAAPAFADNANLKKQLVEQNAAPYKESFNKQDVAGVVANSLLEPMPFALFAFPMAFAWAAMRSLRRRSARARIYGARRPAALGQHAGAGIGGRLSRVPPVRIAVGGPETGPGAVDKLATGGSKRPKGVRSHPRA